MTRNTRVRVYIACSLDGFIAGPGDDLSWLPGADAASKSQDSPDAGVTADSDPGALGFDAFLADVGALLMGRRTYDIVMGFGGAWPYGERPVLVATHRPLEAMHPSAWRVSGDIAQMVAAAREAAGGRDVYLDGGNLIRQALDAGLVDHLIVTMVPVLLGEGHPLFAGVTRRHTLELTGHYRYGGNMVQIHARPAGTA